jgi:hypothetical protein
MGWPLPKGSKSVILDTEATAVGDE